MFSGAGQREPWLEAFTLRVAPGSLTLWLVHLPDHTLSSALSLFLAVRSDESRVEQPSEPSVVPLTCWTPCLQPGWTRWGLPANLLLNTLPPACIVRAVPILLPSLWFEILMPSVKCTPVAITNQNWLLMIGQLLVSEIGQPDWSRLCLPPY